MKIMHARAVWIVNGSAAGRSVGKPLCGAANRHTTDDKFVTCRKCLRMMAKRGLL